MPQNCAGGTLSVFTPNTSKPWNATRVSHLYKRLGFGANYNEIQAALLLTPSQVVDQLITDAKNAPLPTPPVWYNWNDTYYSDFNMESIQQYLEWYLQWLTDMLTTSVREKVALFWHNHFVTRFVDYRCPSYMYEYHKLLQVHAFGNFKTFVKEIGKTPAMLMFLDGRLNRKNRPNENYARELFELFTLGVNNGYDQTDITEAARALTGWTARSADCAPFVFSPSDFDNGSKTVFGQNGSYDFDTLHDLIFTERAMEVSQHIATKIYTQFVHTIPNQTIVDGLAQTFRDSNFEIEPVLLQLFKSDHFYEDEIISVNIKSPVDCLLMLPKEGNLPYDSQVIEAVGYLTVDMGQQLFNPIDVSGWNGNRAWIDSTAITTRWKVLEGFLGYLLRTTPPNTDKESLRQLAIDVSSNSSDVTVVARKITDHFIPKGLEIPTDYDTATTALKAGLPDFYFTTPGAWDLNFQYAPEQVYNLMKWLVKRPEFQLM